MSHSTDLVPVFTGMIQNQAIPLCNARDLHVTLESGQQFADWIKNRIEQYGFTEGEDYFIKSGNRAGGSAGKRRTDYHLTLDMAKELAMVENNERGRQVRRYFIALEKEARAKAEALPPSVSQALPDPMTKNLRQRINRKAHQLATDQFDTIHDLVHDLVERNLRCDATEAQCEDYIERFGSNMGGVVMINKHDLYQLCRQTTRLLDQAGAALHVIHRLERHTGMELYQRDDATSGLPESLVASVLGKLDQKEKRRARRDAAIRAALASGVPADEVALKYGVSRATAYRA